MSNPIPNAAAYSPSYLPLSPHSTPSASSLVINEVARNALSSATPENPHSLQAGAPQITVFRHPHMQRISSDEFKLACRNLCDRTPYRPRSQPTPPALKTLTNKDIEFISGRRRVITVNLGLLELFNSPEVEAQVDAFWAQFPENAAEVKDKT